MNFKSRFCKKFEKRIYFKKRLKYFALNRKASFDYLNKLSCIIQPVFKFRYVRIYCDV